MKSSGARREIDGSIPGARVSGKDPRGGKPREPMPVLEDFLEHCERAHGGKTRRIASRRIRPEGALSGMDREKPVGAGCSRLGLGPRAPWGH